VTVERIKRFLRTPVAGPLIIMLLVAVGVALTTDRFLSRQNLMNVWLQVSIIAIVAIGATIVILTAQIDLSSGSLVALASVILAGLIKEMGVPVPLSILLVIAMGAALGLFNGFFSTYGRIPSFIFTLGTLAIFRGLAFLYTQGAPIFSVSPQLNPLFYRTFLGMPLPFVYVMVLYAAAWGYLRYTEGGRNIYAVGGNDSAARLSGINVNLVRTRAFVIAGFMSGLAGVLLTARLDSGSPNYGQGYELTAIAAAVIGGASLFGGHGNVFATLFGALTIVLVQNGLNLHGVPAAWQEIALGAIIAVAVGVDMWRRDIGQALGRLFGGRPRQEAERPAPTEPPVRTRT
jgi:ribose transport system permease protein